MNRRNFVITAAALGVSNTALASAIADEKPTMTQGTIPLTKSFQLDSRHVGDRFEITIAEPFTLIPGFPEPANCRILYALDAPFTGGSVISTTRHIATIPGMPSPGAIDPLIVVNIGYPIDTLEDFHDYITFKRNRDLVPPGEAISEALRSLTKKTYEPRADLFLKFIEEELDPFVRQQCSIAGPQKAALMGHSYGGLFATYAFAQQSPAFDHYLIFSPGLVNATSPVLSQIENADEHSLEGRVYMSMAQYEEAYTKTYDGRLGINFHKLCAAMGWARQNRLQLMTAVAMGETHASIPYAQMLPGLRWLFESAANRNADLLGRLADA